MERADPYPLLDPESGSSVRILPYPSGLDDPINKGVDPSEVRRKERVNAAWWREFRKLMAES